MDLFRFARAFRKAMYYVGLGFTAAVAAAMALLAGWLTGYGLSIRFALCGGVSGLLMALVTFGLHPGHVVPASREVRRHAAQVEQRK